MSHYSLPDFLFWGLMKDSPLPHPQGQSLLTAHSSSCLMGPASLRGYWQDNLQSLIKFIFWLLFLSLISQSDTLHWNLKGEQVGEVHWYTVLLDFWLEIEMSCGLTWKSVVFQFWRIQIWTWWVIYPLSGSVIGDAELSEEDGRQLLKEEFCTDAIKAASSPIFTTWRREGKK